MTFFKRQSDNELQYSSAEKKLSKYEFSNEHNYATGEGDWLTYPTADYQCPHCQQIIAINMANLEKHWNSEFTNLSVEDKARFDKFSEEICLKSPSFLDFYCPGCKSPVSIYYSTWAGGHHGDYGFKIEYIIDVALQ